MEKAVISLQSLQFTYPGSVRPTLDIPSLEIAAGEKVFLFGPSGCGKTTLLEVMSGVLVPQEGRVEVAGTDLMSLSPSQRDQWRAEKMGYVFQRFNLLPYLSVRENIELPLQIRGLGVGEEAHRFLMHLVEQLGLQEILGNPVQKLSVGQQQRVAVARALLGKPQILFADEPTSSLDYDNRERFLQVLFKLSQEVGTTVLFVSHDRSLESLFDRCLSFKELNRAFQGAN